MHLSIIYIYIYIYIWEFKTLTLWYVLFLKIGCCHTHIFMPSFGGMGGSLFIVSVTRGIVVVFFVRIVAGLLLRNLSFRTFVCFRRYLCCLLDWLYRGADKSLARPGRKKANVSVRMAWISFSALPCRKSNLMTARVSMLLKSRASLTCFRKFSLAGGAKDLSAPRIHICCRL